MVPGGTARRWVKLGRVSLAVVGTAWCCAPESKNDAGARPWYPRLLPRARVSVSCVCDGLCERHPRLSVSQDGRRMEILYRCVGGVDVHKKQVTVTARTPGPLGGARRETTRTFRTFYGELLAVARWLA